MLGSRAVYDPGNASDGRSYCSYSTTCTRRLPSLDFAGESFCLCSWDALTPSPQFTSSVDRRPVSSSAGLQLRCRGIAPLTMHLT